MDGKYEELRGLLRDLGRVVVAHSGGVDSTLLLKVANDCLGEDALAIIGTSPSLPGHEQEGPARIAREPGAQDMVIDVHEMGDPRYVANDARR